MELRATIEEIEAILRDAFPQAGTAWEICSLEAGRAVVKVPTGHEDLRPGGTVSGPAMFQVADLAFYVASMGVIGADALTVTTHCSIDFMRKPHPGHLRGEARVLKRGRTLVVGDVLLFDGHAKGPVAHASITYAIPSGSRDDR